VTVAFGSRDLLLFRHLSLHLGELPRGTHLGTLPGCGHVPMADNPLAVTALITASTAGGLPGKRQAPIWRPKIFTKLTWGNAHLPIQLIVCEWC
jgi:hypothetical protein